ncbi:hypothetical protein KP509_07G082600 [Ceratopteris richardii]|uniref:Uncharacterized protein n=1 Tax=Ceratopteris richardii TaxID=49495 RepID=A0A8T2UIN4_CERRI|nr:hypothetical protein KP509_07G082600 [Ceratopteris richardii]
MGRHTTEIRIHGSFEYLSDAPLPLHADEDDNSKDCHLCLTASVAMDTQPLMMKIERKSSEQAIASQAAMADIISNSPSLINISNILDIMRETSTLLRMNIYTLLWIMFTLILPVSAVLLSAPWLLQQLRHIRIHLKAYLDLLAAALGILDSLLFEHLLSALFTRVVSYCLSFPVFFTCWLLAKAFIIFTVSATYTNRKPSVQLFKAMAPKLYKRLLYTYSFLGLFAILIFITIPLMLSTFIAMAKGIQLSARMMIIIEMGMGIGSSVLLANALVCADVATVVSVLEESVGAGAVGRAMNLTKGKIQTALWLALVTVAAMAMVETLFQSRVIGVEGGRYQITAGTRLWEAPLLICMHAFILLYHSIMITVFYFSCRSAHQCQHQQQIVLPVFSKHKLNSSGSNATQ